LHNNFFAGTLAASSINWSAVMERVKFFAMTAIVEPSDVGELKVVVDLREWQVKQLFVDLAHTLGREGTQDLLEGLE